MVRFRSILCPVDFSDPSQHALRWAVALAARYGSRLVVLNAVDPLLAEAAKARVGLDLAKQEVEPALREFVRATLPDKAPWLPPVHFSVRAGDPPEVILEAAGREVGPLIVMGTQGLGGFRKLLLGSTTERVLRRTHGPVLAVPPLATESVALEASGARVALRKLMIASDFSDAAVAAIRLATDVANEFEVPILVAHVVEPLKVAPQWQTYVDETAKARIEDARAQLERWTNHWCGAQACEMVVSVGSPADSLASMAEEARVGLIVLGLAAEQGLMAPRPGSIAYRVLCLAKVPVLVTPSDEPSPTRA